MSTAVEACPAHVHDTSETCPIGGGREYHIKWRGWGSRWNTWEPERHIIDQVILTEWEETKARRTASAARSSASAPHPDERDQPLLAEEAEGLKLHLSSGSTTGYKGVRKHTQAGRFEARHCAGSRTIYIGVFDSAVEAAVAYARAVGERRT